MNIAVKNPEIVKLVAEIDRYRALSGMSKTAFGVWTVNDPNLLRDLENGRDPRWPTIEGIRAKMNAAPVGGAA